MEPKEDVIFDSKKQSQEDEETFLSSDVINAAEAINNEKKDSNENALSDQNTLSDEKAMMDVGLQSSMELQGVVIAEFNLLSLDSPNAAPKTCEIITNKPYFLIGRSVNCDYRITFKDKYVADEQTSIAYSIEEESYVIRCLAKDNPIFVDGKKVSNDSPLYSGNIIKLGVATNAPKIRFYIEGEELVHKIHKKLSDTFSSLQRGKEYLVGGDRNHDIFVEDTSVSGTVVHLKVPQEGNHLILKTSSKNNVVIAIDGNEVHVNESRILRHQKCLQIGNSFSLLHDVSKFHAPRVPKQCLMSDFIPSPERGSVYTIGKSEDATFRIKNDKVPFLLAEIEAPLEGDCFYIKKISSDIPIFVDRKIIAADPRNGTRFGVNQILRIGDYWEIRNNHRSLPAPKKSFAWKTFVTGIMICTIIAGTILGAMYAINEFSPKIREAMQPKNTLKQYQKNIFYIATFDKSGNQSISSGTGFVVAKKDAKEKNIFYIITCKHVVQPWKFEKHIRKGGESFDVKGHEMEGNYIALWPYNSQVIDPEKTAYLLGNSFHNLPDSKGLGSVSIHKLAEDEYEEVEKFTQHKKNSNGDLAILKISFDKEKWNYDYHEWNIVNKEKLNAGDKVTVLGYSLGGGRLLNKRGIAKPVVCEGKVSSESKSGDFVELDVNQTNGSSGGPILDQEGNIVGIVSFADGKQNLVYGIHSKILEELMR